MSNGAWEDPETSPAERLDGTLMAMAREVAEVNTANGWYVTNRTFGDGIALLHSEVSEMLEEFREHHHTRTLFKCPTHGETVESQGRVTYELADGVLAKPVGVGSECADVLIRLLDTCARHGVDLGLEFRRKMAYNRTRGYKHGGKAL